MSEQAFARSVIIAGTGSEPAAMTPGHTHERTGAGGLGGRQEAGLGQQSGLEHGGHGREALAGAGAGAGAAGVGGPALHHHPGVLPAVLALTEDFLAPDAYWRFICDLWCHAQMAACHSAGRPDSDSNVFASMIQSSDHFLVTTAP